MSPSSVTVSSRGVERILSGHVWIYRADVTDDSRAEPGDVVQLIDRKKRFWGQALYSSKSQIVLRLLTREKRPFDKSILAERIRAAYEFRQQVARGAQAYRLVAAEGDLLPSLIVDRYGGCFVLQTLREGMEKLNPAIVQILNDPVSPLSILQRNDAAIRALEGLSELKGVLAGEPVSEVIVEENGMKFCYDLLGGQKTGGFLDQRENRAAARQYARGRLLDCFCYAGGVAINPARPGGSLGGVCTSQKGLGAPAPNPEIEKPFHV